jgi:hypothetical protein
LIVLLGFLHASTGANIDYGDGNGRGELHSDGLREMSIHGVIDEVVEALK